MVDKCMQGHLISFVKHFKLEYYMLSFFFISNFILIHFFKKLDVLLKTVGHWTRTYGIDKLGDVLSLKKSGPGLGFLKPVTVELDLI